MFKMNFVEPQDLIDICKGKITWVKCQDCDVDGFQYWDGETGMGVCNNPSYIDPDKVERGVVILVVVLGICSNTTNETLDFY